MAHPEIKTLLEIESLKSQLNQALTEGVQNGDLTLAQTLHQEIQTKIESAKNTLCPYPYYPINVDYDLTLTEIIKLGDFNWVGIDFDMLKLPPEGTGQKQLNLYIFKPSLENTNTDTVIKEMEKCHFRPATFKELLTLGAKGLAQSRAEYSLIALGSIWRSFYAPYRSPNGGLDLCWIASGWNSAWRFAAIKI